MALSSLAAAMRLGRQFSGRPLAHSHVRITNFKPNRNLVPGSGPGGYGSHNLASAMRAGRNASGFHLRGQKTGTAATGAGTAGAAGPAAAPTTGSPLDAEYYQNVAQNQFDTNNRINSLNLRQSNAQTNLQTQLAALAHQEPLDQLRAEQQANARGALYSTPYGQQLGNLTYGYGTRQNQAQTGYGQLASGIASQIAALQGGEGLYNTGQYLGAAERASAAAQKNPAIGESASPLPAAQASPVAKIATRIAPHRAPARRAPARRAPARHTRTFPRF